MAMKAFYASVFEFENGKNTSQRPSEEKPSSKNPGVSCVLPEHLMPKMHANCMPSLARNPGRADAPLICHSYRSGPVSARRREPPHGVSAAPRKPAVLAPPFTFAALRIAATWTTSPNSRTTRRASVARARC